MSPIQKMDVLVNIQKKEVVSVTMIDNEGVKNMEV